MVDRILEAKSMLLAAGQIHVPESLTAESVGAGEVLPFAVTWDNLYTEPWIFVRLNDSVRVRMVAVPYEAPFELERCGSTTEHYNIKKAEEVFLYGVVLDPPLIHCPSQAFFNLYEYCGHDCKFCSLPVLDRTFHDTYSNMRRDIARLGVEKLHAIGITAGIPAGISTDNVAIEMAEIVQNLRNQLGCDIPIGVSPYPCSADSLRLLRRVGANEIRINIEIFNEDLLECICPGKSLKRGLECIATAVGIFGRNKVSSNILLGLGESDDDVIAGVEKLASLGAVATLYPLDMVAERESELREITDGRAGRPSAGRIMHLAQVHKAILSRYHLDPRELETMCPACAASHIMPFVDF